MATFSFEKLEVYNKALDFAYAVFIKAKSWPKEYQFNICDQIRRASLSIPLNIAEGSSKSKLEYKRFLSISRGSCFECIPIIELARRLKLLSTEEKDEWYNSCVGISMMLSKLRSSIK